MIPLAPFGRTGHLSTRTLFGAAAFWSVTQADADRTLDLLTSYGVNHIDTAASYGESEIRLGPWLKHHRAEVFLATKTEQRTRRRRAKSSIVRWTAADRHGGSLAAAQPVQPGRVAGGAGPGGALEAFVEARQAGWSGSWGLRVTDWGSRRCTARRWSALPSTQCCCPGTQCCSKTPPMPPTLRRCWRFAANGRWLSKSSRRSPAAAGATDRTPTPPGMSR